jgi:hypothetical protein
MFNIKFKKERKRKKNNISFKLTLFIIIKSLIRLISLLIYKRLFLMLCVDAINVIVFIILIFFMI